MNNVTIQVAEQMPVASRRAEHVERKGLGHPDTICDSVMEAISVALSRTYIDTCGRVLHHNLDKGLLVAGQSAPQLGGGRIIKPMRLIFGDRATQTVDGRAIPVGDIARETAKQWLRSHLRFVDPDRHIEFQNEILPGSPELVDIFARPELTANDTSVGVGYAPLTETERLVLTAERYLNSADFKSRFPEVGEDIKVMAFRLDRRLSLTIAAALVDRFITDSARYWECKLAVCQDLQQHLESQLVTLDAVDLTLNSLDQRERGLGGLYLTVLGTSAEGADGGEVGRGNRVNGLISLHRPMTTEAAAGKNPVSHVGKIYNLLAHQLAERICASLEDVQEANVWLCSQIGRPLADPWSVAVELVAAPRTDTREFEPLVRDIVARELSELPAFVQRLICGELPVC
jgi:S-adenosylmethionine synthetase